MLDSTSIIGFDSAWTDNPRAPGAICIIRTDREGRVCFEEPELASFNRALEIIRTEQATSPRVLVALDQPTIVGNLTGSRPVERVAASYISWIGGGVQPSNRGRAGMFDDSAPIWSFKTALDAIEDPERARHADEGLFIMEVFPALALPGMHGAFSARLAAPRYNPQRRKTFKLDHWQQVVAVIETFAAHYRIYGIEPWCLENAAKENPSKADQDRLDAVICALIGLHWLKGPRALSTMIGDRETGYIVAPSLGGVHERLVLAARKLGVAVDGVVSTADPN